VFEEEGARQARGVRVAQRSAAYRLPPNEERITLEKIPWTAPEEVKVEGPDEKALVYRGGEMIEWKVV
jgi:dihydroorotase